MTTTSVVPGIVTDVGAVADAVTEGEKLAEQIANAAEAAQNRQAGNDAATAKGQTDVLTEIALAKSAEDAGKAPAGSPDAQWADGVHDTFRRPD